MTYLSRDDLLTRLDGATLDLLVVGAGIVGTRVAYEAARAGLKTALVDAGDIAGATSGASSKLVHGGLRYLAARGGVRLVRECQAERRILAARIAPHLVSNLPMVLLVDDPRRRGRFLAAMALYAALTGFRERPRIVSADTARALVPVKDVPIPASAILAEKQTHDGRLCLATARGAQAAGALVATYLQLAGLERVDGMVEASLSSCLGEGSVEVRCRAIVNASGARVDDLRRIDDPAAAPLVRLSKGVHVVLPLVGRWHAGMALFAEDRSAFAVPWQGVLLLGVTDTAFEGDCRDVVAAGEDVESLLEQFRDLLPEEQLRPELVLSTFAALRALARGDGDTAVASREHVLHVARGGMVSVAGGKLTRHRLIAIEALRHLPARVRPRVPGPSDDPLPGVGPIPPRPRDVDPEAWRHLVGLYGADTRRLLAYGDDDPCAFEPIAPGGPDVWAQVRFAVETELALTAADVLRRRTTVAIRGLASDAVHDAVAERLSCGVDGASGHVVVGRRSANLIV